MMFTVFTPRAALIGLALSTLACSVDKQEGTETDGATQASTTDSASVTEGASTTSGATSDANATADATGEATTGDSAGATTGTDGGATDGSSGTTDPTVGGGGDWPLECDCFYSGCGEGACPQVVASCEGDCEDSFTVDEDALTCALEALRDGAAGQMVSWRFNAAGGWEVGDLFIRDDRLAIRGTFFDKVVCKGKGSVIHGPLPGSAVFEACLADPSPAARFDCLRQELAAENILCAPPEDDGCD